MANSKKPKSWAEQLADLDDPAPKELDPEDDAGPIDEEDSSDSARDEENRSEAREHYMDVGKSKLRKPNGVDLGPRYTGASVSRDALVANGNEDDIFSSHSEQEESDSAEYADPDEELELEQSDVDEEIESGEAFESGDEEKFAKFTFRDSGTLGASGIGEGSSLAADGLEDADSEDEGMEDGFDGLESAVEEEDVNSDDIDMDDEEGAADDDSDDTSISDGPSEPKADDRAALRKMMAEEQKTVAASLSKAAKADVAKGRAIKHQRTTFDSLLNTRIKLQKALIATNSLAASSAESNDYPAAIKAAENAALKLWHTISSLRSSLPPSSTSPPHLTPPSPTTSTLWTTMQHHESLNLPPRRTTLTKWSHRTLPATALPRPGTFSQTPTHTPLLTLLDQHLAGPHAATLLQKTQTPRSCAPLQAAAHIPSDPSIYDDADFYTLLLRELVDRRMTDSTTGIAPNGSSRQFKVKKVVDTKASKGRKMRYTVHEKLQNFMAPEDRGGWGERRRGELFGGLLGGRVGLGEEGDGDGDGDGDEDEGEGGLRLFG